MQACRARKWFARSYRHTYGHGRRLEFKIPRDRYGNFRHQILAILRNQEEECERLQRDFRRVTRMRGAMPNDESVIVLMGRTAMDKTSYIRTLPGIQTDTTLFPKRERKMFCYV